MHQVEIEWVETPCEDTTGLRIDPNRYTYKPGVHLRYIDFINRDGETSAECFCVTFRGTTPEEEGRVMQTVLMLAKARYGL